MLGELGGLLVQLCSSRLCLHTHGDRELTTFQGCSSSRLPHDHASQTESSALPWVTRGLTEHVGMVLRVPSAALPRYESQWLPSWEGLYGR